MSTVVFFRYFMKCTVFSAFLFCGGMHQCTRLSKCVTAVGYNFKVVGCNFKVDGYNLKIPPPFFQQKSTDFISLKMMNCIPNRSTPCLLRSREFTYHNILPPLPTFMTAHGKRPPSRLNNKFQQS